MGQKKSKSLYTGVGKGAYIALLQKEGITLSKEKGQHLLLNPTLLARLCDVGEVRNQDAILEIGAGVGNLTRVLAQRARKVLAIEIDRRFQPILEKILAPYPNVVLLFEDFLKMDKDRLCSLLPPPFKVVSNIPFSITAPILQKLVELREILSSVVLTVQKEVADKLLPPPNRHITPLSLYVTFHFKIERFFVIPKNTFFPPPEVDARVIRLIPQSPPVSLQEEDKENFFHFLREILRYKRKNLKNALENSGYYPSNVPISLDRRLETLTWEDLKCLYLAVKK